MLKRTSFFLLLSLLILFTWMGNEQEKQKLYTQADALAIPKVGYKAPDFTLVSFQGESVSLEEFDGTPVFLNFWASWCPPCKAEMPDMVEVAKMYEGEVQFIGVNMATQDRIEAAESFLDEYDVFYTNVIDETRTVADMYQITAIPTTFVIDRDGVITYRKLGGMTKREMEATIEEVIERGR
ncbi:TlpA family protein disulfide reductase [Bacillus sp. FJAT-45350]|uniref:TlpA family protein disulfide reductase n=1 Tax=Bacillus sp. FJAT-45350 TaxID=2011014 RepID=UPI001C54AC24|nr:TlpA disulfide reductase family protein [Bacillus sp. FJAT-45350]